MISENTMPHVSHIYAFRQVGLGLTQLCLGFLVESNSWIVNGKHENCEADAKEYWNIWFLTNVLEQSSISSFRCAIKNQMSSNNLSNFKCLHAQCREKVMEQQKQKMRRENFVAQKLFRQIFQKSVDKTSFKFPATHMSQAVYGSSCRLWVQNLLIITGRMNCSFRPAEHKLN